MRKITNAGMSRASLGWLAFGLAFAASAAHADSVNTSLENGFARVLFTFDTPAHASAQLTGGVLTVSFDRKVDLAPSAAAQGLGAYIGSVRADADGKAWHFALTQAARLHTSTSGAKFAVDLAQQSFTGTPPDLPPPPPKGAVAVDISKLAPLKVRAGTYPNFTRIVFDWPQSVPYTVFPGASHLTLRFEAMANPDFAPFTRAAPPWVKQAGWRIENKGMIVEFDIDAGAGYHDFRDGSHVVLDVLAPKADASVYSPPLDNGKPGPKTKVTKLTDAKSSGVSTAQAQAVVDAASKVNGTEPAAAKPQAPPAPAPAPVTPPATPVPTTTAAATAPDESAAAQRTKDGAAIVFPGAAAHAVSVFVRGMTAWIVLDGEQKIDPARLKTSLRDLPDFVDGSTGNGITLLRIGLKQPMEIAARAEGRNLKVVIATHVGTAPAGIDFVHNASDKPALETLMPGATRVVTLGDPIAGDVLDVVPAAPGRGEIAERNYMEFSVLPSAAGLVVTPFTDDLNIAVADARVTISRPAGLALTPAAVAITSPGLLASASEGPCFIDFAAWSKSFGGSLLSTERKLQAQIAAKPPEGANAARLQLARFYLANGFAAETLGLIALMQASDPKTQGDLQLQTMRAAADYMMARYKDAHSDIAADQFDADRHAAFWRGLTEAALENWEGAKAAFAQAEPVFARYPAEWQARARLAEADAALATKGLETADVTLARLPRDLPKALMLEAQLERARLYAQEGRLRAAGPLFSAVEHGGVEPIAAKAVYYRTDAWLGAGAMTLDRGIDQLEQLRFRWRGDALELKTLRKLGALYFARARWREGLQTLKVASLNFPNEDLSRQAQDDMRSAFADLFLKGNADKIAPIEALGLFYDFIDLTPIGPDGDEMIRRMSDRLVAVDLLGPAASLLNYQVTKRLDGLARGQVAARLAMIQLMDHKPKDALETLRGTQVSGLPDDVNHQRLLLEARALAALKQWDQALDMVAVDQAPDSRRLRADIYWESGNWAVAAQKTEELLGARYSDTAPLSDSERLLVMRAAISYSLASDETSLQRLSANFGAKMKASPDANAFAVVAQPIDAQGTAFRDMAAKIASVDTLEAFMKDFRKRYEVAAATN